MRTIVVAAKKGGVGKTTLAIALATAKIAKGDRVAMLDLDSFKILTRWEEARRQFGGSALNLQRSSTRLEDLIESIRDSYDWLIVDVPPLPPKTVEAAVSIGDLIVIPLRPSPLDIGQTDRVAELCERAGRPFVFVPTLSANTELLAGARAALKKKGQVSASAMAMRDVYMTALLDGKSGNEISNEARQEIEELWRDLEGALRVERRRRAKR